MICSWSKYIKNSCRIVSAVAQKQQDVPYFNSFITKSRLNDLDDIGQGQRSWCMTQPLMLVIICAKFRNDPFRTVAAVECTQQDVSYFSSCICLWQRDLEKIFQGQKSLHPTLHLKLVIICPKYGKHPSKTVGVTEWIWRITNKQNNGPTDSGPFY